jgi:hypothetical protein
MMRIGTLLALLLLQLSCVGTSEKKDAADGSSIGEINTVSIVIDDQLWNSEIGDTLRKKWAAPVDGLPQEEPLFTLNQYPTKLFEGMVKKNRNIVVLRKGKKSAFVHQKNRYAAPQQLFYITAPSSEELIRLVEQKSAEITNIIKSAEIKEQQKRILITPVSDQLIQEKFSVKMALRSNYKYELVAPKFLWIRRELATGYNSLLLYEVPIAQIEKNNAIVNNILNIRDSIGKKFIHGSVGRTWMVTEKAYSPYFLQTQIDGKLAYETKGTWQLKNDFMAGPFINYAIKDLKNNRYLILDGFTYNPSKAKRDLVFELEAMMKSVAFIP